MPNALFVCVSGQAFRARMCMCVCARMCWYQWATVRQIGMWFRAMSTMTLCTLAAIRLIKWTRLEIIRAVIATFTWQITSYIHARVCVTNGQKSKSRFCVCQLRSLAMRWAFSDCVSEIDESFQWSHLGESLGIGIDANDFTVLHVSYHRRRRCWCRLRPYSHTTQFRFTLDG